MACTPSEQTAHFILVTPNVSLNNFKYCYAASLSYATKSATTSAHPYMNICFQVLWMKGLKAEEMRKPHFSVYNEPHTWQI